MKICGIYKITSPTNKVYIGRSTNILQRFSCYKGKHCKAQKLLYNSLDKYGYDNHKFEIICQCDQKEIGNLEKYYIELYQCFNSKYGLNLRDGGGSFTHSIESKLKISNSRKGKKLSEETKQKMSLAAKGKPKSRESVLKGSLTRTGIKRSPDIALKIVATRRKNNRYICSEETRLKRSNSLKGEKNPNFGKHLSEEVRKKISSTLKKNWNKYYSNRKKRKKKKI